MQTALTFGILVPGVRHFFLHLARVGQIERQHLAQVLVQNDPARHKELAHVANAILRNIAVRHVISETAADSGPVRIE